MRFVPTLVLLALFALCVSVAHAAPLATRGEPPLAIARPPRPTDISFVHATNEFAPKIKDTVKGTLKRARPTRRARDQGSRRAAAVLRAIITPSSSVPMC